jgi:phage gp29-like protein
MVTGTVQRVVNALWTLNRFPGEPPGFVMQDDIGLELDRAERDKKLAEAGIVRFTEQYILDAYDLTEEHFTIPTAAVPAVPGPARVSASAQPADHFLAANGQRFTADQELVEGLIDRALGQAESPIPAELIARTIRASESPSDLAERLAGLYAGQDAAAFRELMERSLFAADVLGYVTAERRIGALPEPE